MTARILDGKAIAKDLRSTLREQVKERLDRNLRAPGLAVILIGNDPASLVYVKAKRRDCEEVGFYSAAYHFEDDISQVSLEALLDQLNADPQIHGILVQNPLPVQISTNAIIERINPLKDVDGFHPYNIGRLAVRRPALRSCTPLGVMQLLDHTGVTIRGLDATVIGASNHLGRPMGLELLMAGCTVTTAHKFSRDIRAAVERADLVVSAVGKPGLVSGDWIKPGAIVIDVGITRAANGKLRGDVQFESASERASWITPVPGGVGPMTVISLLQNTLTAARWADEK